MVITQKAVDCTSHSPASSDVGYFSSSIFDAQAVKSFLMEEMPVGVHHFVIMGAGIGGLATALALSQLGHCVTILEQAKELKPIGSGLQLGPNAVKVLENLGLGQQLAAIAYQPDTILVRLAKNGRQIGALPARGLGSFFKKKKKTLQTFMRERFGSSYVTVHRVQLQKILLQALQENPLVKLFCDIHIERVDGLQGIVYGNKSSWQGDVVIDCCGLWGVLTGTQNANPVVPSGDVAWRCTVPLTKQVRKILSKTCDVNVWIGKNYHAVTYPVKMDQEAYQNLVLDEVGTHAIDLSKVKKEQFANNPCHLVMALNVVVVVPSMLSPEIQALYDGLQEAKHEEEGAVVVNHQQVRTKVAPKSVLGSDIMNEQELQFLLNKQTPLTYLFKLPIKWVRWELCAHRELCTQDNMFSKRTPKLLHLGDAVHPMRPYFAQGAAMALEDAWSLACAVSKHKTQMSTAFEAWAKERAPRNASVQQASRRNGKIYHMQPWTAWARDLALKFNSERMMRSDWLYGYQHPERDDVQ